MKSTTSSMAVGIGNGTKLIVDKNCRIFGLAGIGARGGQAGFYFASRALGASGPNGRTGRVH